MSSSPFAALLDYLDVDHSENTLLGLRYAEVASIEDDGYILTWLTSGDEAPSAPARAATMMAGGGRGSFFMPEVGDEVVVGFEDGDLDSPVILGALWSNVDAPPDHADTSSSNNIRTLTSRLGHQLTFDDSPGAGKVTLQSAGGSKLEFDDTGQKITLQLNESTKIELSAAGISIQGARIDLN